MQRLLIILSMLLLAASTYGQVKNRFRGTLNVYGVSGTSPTYTLSGFFNDQLGQFNSTDVSVGDYVFMNNGTGCARFQITTINSNTGGLLEAVVEDVDNVTSAFPTGIGAVLNLTPQAQLPTYISGIDDNLLSCIQTHFALMVDSLTADPSVLPVASITPGSSTSLALDLEGAPGRVYQIDMSSASTSNPVVMSISNPVDGGVYTWRFFNTASNEIDFPASVLNQFGTTWDGNATFTVSADFFMTCFYDGSNFYCK